MSFLVNENPIDEAYAKGIENFPLVECKTEHFFVPGFYIRKCTMPAGSMVISCIHKQRHPYWVDSGRCQVWTENEGWAELKAGDCGITEPGTQRILVIQETTEFLTMQRTTLTDTEEIEKELVEQYVNPFVPKEIQIAAQQFCRGDVRYLEGQE